MGYIFAAALLKKTTTAPGTRKAFREAMDTLGYRKVAAEEASLSLCMYQDKKSQWLSLALDMPNSLKDELEFLRKVSAEMHTPILYFWNFDSDFLYVAATDGKAVQHVHVGYIDEDEDEENAEAMQDSEDLSLFDALLPDDEARAELRRILAVDDEERIFSESAAQEMAALFGYTPEVLFIDEDAPAFAELHFDLPGGDAVPFLMPEDAPVKLRLGSMGLGNPSDVAVFSNGGVGKGIRVVLLAEDYDVQDWELPVIWLNGRCPVNRGELSLELQYSEKVVPTRCRFQDGKAGWIAEFPDAPLYQGVNPDSPLEFERKGFDYHYAHSLSLHIAFRGGTFSLPEPQKPEGAEATREAMTAWNWARWHYFHCGEGHTDIQVIPLENPEQGFHTKLPRSPFDKRIWNDWLRGYWPDDELK